MSRYGRSVLVEFVVRDDRVVMLETRQVGKPSRRGAPLVDGPPGAFWVELLDARDRTVYRRPLADPFACEVAVCAPADAAGAMRAGPVSVAADGGHVLVPPTEDATTVAFFAGARRVELGRAPVGP